MAEALPFLTLRDMISRAVAEELFNFCTIHKCNPGHTPAQGFIDLWCSQTFPGWRVRVSPPVIKRNGEPDFLITTYMQSFE